MNVSKLYDKYLELKKRDSNKCYLFKSGMFFLFIEKDAEFVGDKLGLKITKLNDSVNKCGFPISAIDKYVEKLRNNKIKFIIVDGDATVSNTSKYLSDRKITDFIEKLKKMDLNDISYKEAYNLLINFRKVVDKNGWFRKASNIS